MHILEQGRTRERIQAAWVFALALFIVPVAFAKVEVAKIFSDHMVLQRETEAPVWGNAAPREAITVKFAGQVVKTSADENGRWRVTLKPMKASHESRVMTVEGKDNSVTVKDVLVGEVWFASGQSNMVMQVFKTLDAEQVMAGAKDPKLRYAQGQFGRWAVVDAGVARNMSAVAYHFARELREHVGVPVGVIVGAVGGTRIELWTAESGMKLTESGRKYLAEARKRRENYDPVAAKRAYQATLARWEKATAARREAGKRVPPKPREPKAPPKDMPLSGVLFRSKVQPAIPFAIRGVLWYQGEANAHLSATYRDYLTGMTNDWRQRWGRPNMPALIVQLPNFRPAEAEPGDGVWCRIREAQANAAADNHNTYVAITHDVGDPNDLHPKNKQPVGQRLALIARANVYGQDIPWTGPRIRKASIQDGKFVVTFEHVDGKLKTKDGKPIKGFAIAGKDRKWVWADAAIDGEKVIVHSGSVAAPVALRYAWADTPLCNLTDASGLPTAPFRTDDWSFVRINKKKQRNKAQPRKKPARKTPPSK